MRKIHRFWSFILALLLSGCGTNLESSIPYSSKIDSISENETTTNVSDEISPITSTSESINVTTSVSKTTVSLVTTTDNIAALKHAEEELNKAEEARLRAEEQKRLTEQRNSFSMMYYLAITAEEIRTSKDNRVVLEDIYTTLLNDINPGAVDEITQDHLRNLRDIIKSYLNISTKRERLQFIYNQEKATAIRNAIPNPVSVLSISNALDWKRLALAVTYTAIDSYNNYKNSSDNADIAFIMSGWELDDEEKETVMKNRDRAFDYMVDMVQEYNLDGLKTLNEKSIENFADICSTKNATEKIKLLKAEESTYSLLGNYWIQLADAYFETSQYSKCLECVEQYEKISTGIYRQDYNYLRILPKAIVAAQETYSGSKYVSRIRELADAIDLNTSTDDWSSRYFAAQVYIDLYSKTNEKEYLEKAYTIASENVTVLLKEQRLINSTYLNDIIEQTIKEPDYRYMTDDEKNKAKKEYKAEKKRVKEYNEALKEKRKTELPSLYEPLIINCELLFTLADKINLSNSEKNEIEAILETSTNGIFMVKPINDTYSFNHTQNKYDINFSKKEIIIPTYLLTSDSDIILTITDNSKSEIIDDCKIKKVERQGNNITGYKTYVSSKKLEKYDWTAESKVKIEIIYNDVYNNSINFQFVVDVFEDNWYGDKVVFKAQ